MTEEDDDTWRTIGRLMTSAALTVLMVLFGLASLTGIWIWSLLI
jgi:hypothetical protein